MTQAPPDRSAPSAPEPQLPPACVEEAWRRARADYERGVSAPVCAERHGLAERTVRRRAAAEGWRKPARLESFHAYMLNRPPPALAGEPLSQEELLEGNPDLEPFVAAHSYEVGELLLDPAPSRLQRFAFRRAAEAAAAGAATEAGAWMRLAVQTGRARDQLERDAFAFHPADLMRARYAADLRAAAEAGPEREEPEEAGEGEG